MSKPFVSVIVPYYNNSRTIEETVESIVAQEDIGLEVIIIDDNSQDYWLLKKVVARFEKSIRLIRLKENLGVAQARNVGIAAAKFDLLAFCDSDDLWEPGKLKRQIKYARQGYLTCSEALYINNQSIVIGKSPEYKKEISLTRILKTNDIIASSVVLSKTILGDRVFPNLRKRQDHALWIDMVSSGIKVFKLSDPLIRYRVSNDSLSGNKWSAMSWSFFLLRRHLRFNFVKSLYFFLWYLVIGFRKQTRRHDN